jgi:UbiD family decarboxylase
VRYRSLGEFVEAADEIGEVKVVHGAGLDGDVGCLTEMASELDGPMLLFDQFEGYPADFRLASNLYRNSLRRYALALGLPVDSHPIDLVRMLRDRKRKQQPMPPVVVGDGPVLTHQMSGSDIDIGRFPAPRWHSDDGGHYIGTGDLLVLRDPDTGWINFGTYRACVQGRDRVSLWIIKYKRGRVIAEKYWARKMPCPAALVLGCDPVTFMASTTQQKYDHAGALHGAPVEVVNAPLTGLPIPAGSEVVFEGEIPPIEEESAHEGPFGEWPGYYSHSGPECVLRVQHIAHRDAPIIHGFPPLRPMLSWGAELPGVAVEVWDHLERVGVTDVTGVWGHCHGLMLVVAIKQRYPGHAEQALMSSIGRISGGMYGYVVVVDDDIDPSNMREVLWALCTRVDPSNAVQIARNMLTSDLDPRLSPEQKASGDYTMGRMLINACKPYRWRESFPKTNIFSEEERRAVRNRWAGLIEELEETGLRHRRAASTGRADARETLLAGRP